MGRKEKLIQPLNTSFEYVARAVFGNDGGRG